MLNIDQETVDLLDFDLDEEVAKFREALEAHRFTINVPAPTANPLVEEIVRAGGYQVIPREPEPAQEIPEELERPSSMVSMEPEQVLAEMRALVLRFEELSARLPEFEARLKSPCD